MLWWILAAIAVVGLIAFAKGPNPVWGTATTGLIIGIPLAIFWPGASWWIVGRAAIVGALIGLVFELPHLLRKRRA